MNHAPFRVAMLGISNELNGNDAAGVLVVRALLKKRTRGKPGMDFSLNNLFIIDAGPSPEAYTGPLRCFHPGLVILIDTAE